MAVYTQAQAHNAATRVTSGTTISKAYGSDNGAGNLLVAAVAVAVTSGVGETFKVTDTAGNGWRFICGTANGLQAISLWCCDQAVGGANTVTATVTATVSSIQMDLHEYAGASTWELVESSGVNNGATGSPQTVATVDSCSANDLIVTAAKSNSASTGLACTGYTADNTETLSGFCFATAHKLDSGTAGVQTPSWTTRTTTAVTIAVVAAFRQTGVASTVPHVRQTTNVLPATGASAALAFGSDTLAGSCLLALIHWTVASGTPNITSLGTSTQSLTYTKAVGLHDATNLMGSDIWYSGVSSAGAESVTANFSPNTTVVAATLVEIAAGASLTLAPRAATLGTHATTTAGTAHSVAEAAASTLGDVVVALTGLSAGTSVVKAVTPFQQLVNSFRLAHSAVYQASSANAIQTATFASGGSVKSDEVIVGFAPTVSFSVTSAAPNVAVAADQTPSFATSITGPVAAVTLAASSGTVATSLTHAAPNVAVAASGGTVATVLPTVTAPNVSIAASGGAAGLVVAGPVATITLTASGGVVVWTLAGQTPNIAVAASGGTVATAVTGPVAAATLAAAAGTLATAIAHGAPNVTLGASGGTLATVTSGPVPNVTLAATAGRVPVIGVAPNVALATPGGTTSTGGAFNVLGPTATIDLAVSGGTLAIGTTAPIATVSLAALAGAVAVKTTGPVVGIAALANGGTVMTGLSGPTAASTLAASGGSLASALSGGIAGVTLVAPGGTAFVPVVGTGLDAFEVNAAFLAWAADVERPAWQASDPVPAWVVELEVPGWQPSPPESSWVTEVST